MSGGQPYYLPTPFGRERARQAAGQTATEVAQLQQVAEELVRAVERLEVENAQLRADLAQLRADLEQHKRGE